MWVMLPPRRSPGAPPTASGALRPRRPGDGAARAAQRPARPGRHPDAADLGTAARTIPPAEFVAQAWRRRGRGRVPHRQRRHGLHRRGRGRRRRASARPAPRQDAEASVGHRQRSRGFGDVVHRLVERQRPGRRVPARRDRDGPGADAGADDDLLLTSSTTRRSACRPASSTPTVAFHEQVFGFTVIFEEYIEVGDQGMISKVVQSPSGGVTFTLIEPDTSRQPRARSTTSWPGTTAPGCSTSRSRTETSSTRSRTLAGRGVGSRPPRPSYYDMLEARLGRDRRRRSTGCGRSASWSTATTGARCTRSSRVDARPAHATSSS